VDPLGGPDRGRAGVEWGSLHDIQAGTSSATSTQCTYARHIIHHIIHLIIHHLIHIVHWCSPRHTPRHSLSVPVLATPSATCTSVSHVIRHVYQC